MAQAISSPSLTFHPLAAHRHRTIMAAPDVDGLRERLVEPGQSQYPALSEVRKTLKVQWYRCHLEPTKFAELMKRSDAQAFLQAGGHLLLFTCSGFLVYLCFLWHWWCAMLGALFLHGTIGSCFLFGCHELGHGTVFKTRWLNRFFLYVFSTLSWWDPFDYAMSHTYHHRYTQFQNADRENVFPLEVSLSFKVLLTIFSINLTSGPGRVWGKGGLISHVHLFCRAACGLGPKDEKIPSQEWLARLIEDQPEQWQQSVQWSRWILFFHTMVHVVACITGVWVLPLVLSWHTFTANWLRFFMGLPQHCGLRGDTPDFRKSVRSMTLDPVCEFLYWNMNWHTEHHMFAGVPCYNLKRLHYEVASDMPTPRTLVGAWKEMLETWEKQKIDPTYFFDTPLPETATMGGHTVGENELAASIGDLAPAGLK